MSVTNLPPELGEIETILQWMREGGFAQLAFESEGQRLALTLDEQPLPTSNIVSSGFGRLLLSHPAGGEPYIRPGDTVEPDQIVAMLAAGPVLTAVRATAGGRVVAILAEEGGMIGFGQALVALA
ncbi:acetyl-CoA carboxylase biotin carboxyl carrier protein [Devosia sp. A369]